MASKKLLFAASLAVGAVCSIGQFSQAIDSVQLGKDALTSGIPGSDKLTVAEIKKFLDNPSNHVELKVSLPEGLAAGADAIYIPGDNPLTRAKVELGRQLYFDRRLSGDSSVSCADCHSPVAGFGANTQFGVGVRGQTGNRNSPVSFNRILSKAQFWDGRAGSLEAQAIGPIANPIEMGFTHEGVVKMLTAKEGYRIQFERVFGGKPDIGMVGKAIAAFERTIVTGPSPYDYNEPLRRLFEAFPEELADLQGLKTEDPALFFNQKSNCSACHVGVNFADELYHNLGVGMQAAEPDLGRFAQTKIEKDKGAFKTPTLRNIAQSGPYMHDGSQKTLEEVVEWYAKGGHPNPYLSDKIKKLDLTAQDKTDLVEFMKALTGPFPTIETGHLPE